MFSPPAVRARGLLVVALGALAMSACDRREPPPAARAVIRDDLGEPVPTLATRPARIVSLNPTTTEILFAIGAGARVVGRTTWDAWPAEARAVPDLGPGLRPNVEAVLAARPQLVLLYASEDNRDAARRLRVAGIPTLAYRVDRIADFRRVTLAIGAVTGDTAAARITVDTVQATLDRVRAATAALRRPTVFWPLWESPLLSVGGGSFLDELLTIAGARNVYAELPSASPRVTIEDLVTRDPEIVLASPRARARMRTEARWQTLGAVRDGRVLSFDTTIVNGPSPRVGQSAVGLARLFHPELALR